VLEMMVTPFDDLRPGGEGFWGKQSDSVVSTLVDGVQVGISIQVFDWDLENEEGEPSWWSLDHPTPGPGPPFESDGFSVFELLPAEARPTVASPATWGQAKRACAP